MNQIRIRVYGIVQGVGFRPFVSRLASQMKLDGTVCNKGSYVEIYVQGAPESISVFQEKLQTDAPERSVILKTDEKELPPAVYDGFQIIESAHRSGDVFVSPDIALCPTCKTELYDAKNRRYLHPFINCTACGPRLTILKHMPYDRERTTMADFAMCPDCEKEYTTMGDRRFDAQPVCCHACGPQVYLLDQPQVRGMQAIEKTREVIRTGGIAAVKGIGGFHLCCDAGNEAAVKRLRERKNRPTKPFAVMAKDMDTAERICVLGKEARKLLDSPWKPIVICERRERAVSKEHLVVDAVAPGQSTLGVMLPYAPLQLLLFQNGVDESENAFPEVLVMTSGNRGGAPICRNDREVQEQLSGICDIVLSNDREILIRADDSVVDASQSIQMIRRSRGFAPLPVAMSQRFCGQILAVGGELKNTFCIGKNEFFYLSPYVGDLSDVRSVQALSETVDRMLALFEAQPAAVACDLHPDYQTGAYAKTLGLPLIHVQHHYAHVLSCMAEHDRLADRVIGVAFDGTGYGTDGSVWGGEFLIADKSEFRRVGSLAPFIQMGGDAASREGWRIAVSLLLAQHTQEDAAAVAEALDLCSAGEAKMLAAARSAGLGCVTSTSAGRLFDAVSALLGIQKSSSYEGEAAMALQCAAQRSATEAMETDGKGLQVRCSEDGFVVLEYDEFLEELIQKRQNGASFSAENMAYLFHRYLAEGIAQVCEQVRAREKLQTVVLTGGCFCNQLLQRLTAEQLHRRGFEVLTHRMIPANDGGLALGQAVYAMQWLQDMP
ncbi:MAG: carbamoyltransferase HypF [Eubacterium sp.]|nr:carbamoyltransferase HypF [Eubacterium sp.]